jgi:hypothetical protein
MEPAPTFKFKNRLPTSSSVGAGEDQVMHPVRPAELRGELFRLRARYDDGAVAPAIYGVIKLMETELSWVRHREDMALMQQDIL